MTQFIDLTRLDTEQCNAATQDIDVVGTEEMCKMINVHDQTVAQAVAECIPDLAFIIDSITPRIREGGRVIYIGAGSSGRLGIMDAAEMIPTYSAPPGQWIGIIAGGTAAISLPVEGAEDRPDDGARDLLALRPTLHERDSVIGLSASGRTPYVLGALECARNAGCFTAGLCCVRNSDMRGVAKRAVECIVGPEVVTGSTRMKSGTAQKMMLNMISTGVNIKIGKAYGNLMVDVRLSNAKLQNRARFIFRRVLEPLGGPPQCVRLNFDLSDDNAIDALLVRCGGSVKTAMVAARWSCEPVEASVRLEQAGGLLRIALQGSPSGLHHNERLSRDGAGKKGPGGCDIKEPMATAIGLAG